MMAFRQLSLTAQRTPLAVSHHHHVIHHQAI
jgi:hypothetical protein